MSNSKLDIAFWNYDRGTLLRDGTVKIGGVDATFHSGRIVTDIFEAMIRRRAYDVSELGMTYFLRTLRGAESPFLAIPVFLVRSFRHNAIYINKASGIVRPQDLAGKRIGELGVYGHDAGVMPKGILSDEYGVKADQCRWIVGSIDFPMDPVDFVEQPVPPGVEVEWAGKGADLGEMLEKGEIAALISADIPRCVLAKSPRSAGCSKITRPSSATTTVAPESSRSCTLWSSSANSPLSGQTSCERSTRGSKRPRTKWPSST